MTPRPMKHRYCILLLVDPESRSRRFLIDWDTIPFFPGSREQNYSELLTGFGIPFETIDINRLKSNDLVGRNGIRYSAILFTSPVKAAPAGALSRIETASYRYGISLIADAFLFSGTDFFTPFGLIRCAGRIPGFQHIKTREGETLYKATPYPFTYRRPALGARPLLRFLTQSWFSRKVSVTGSTNVIASFRNGTPAICSFVHGKATNYLLNFHPSPVLNRGNPIHGLLRNLFESNPYCPPVSFDLSRMTCLRLDDPGSCERVHMKGYNPGVISEHAWEKVIGIIKKHHAHLNISYVPRWVDDGDPEKGALTYQKKTIRNRVPGKLYNSWQVTYTKTDKSGLHDYAAEYRAIRRGVAQGLVSILSHGLTHLTPDIAAWSKSTKKYTRLRWYREFRRSPTGRPQPVGSLRDRIAESARLLSEAFSVAPKIIVPSAHEQTPETLAAAREAGFKIVSSKATFLLKEDTVIRNRKIMAFYPKDSDWGASWSATGYPTVFVFHDYDIYRNGPVWLDKQITRLEGEGITSFPSMDWLGALLMAETTPVAGADRLDITIDFRQAPPLRKRNDAIPLKIGGIVAGLQVNGLSQAVSFTTAGGKTFISIPFSCVRDDRVTVSLKLKRAASIDQIDAMPGCG